LIQACLQSLSCTRSTMHWPKRSTAAPAPEEEKDTTTRSFSAPPPSDIASTSRFSAPPSADAPAADPYATADYSKFGSRIYESDGLRDADLARQSRSSYSDQWITHPRARNCILNIQLGAKMGASVGGCFGLLTGAYVAVVQRSPLMLPVSVIGGAISFGFFLGCGMIIRCEESPARSSVSHGCDCSNSLAVTKSKDMRAHQRKFRPPIAIMAPPMVGRCFVVE